MNTMDSFKMVLREKLKQHGIQMDGSLIPRTQVSSAALTLVKNKSHINWYGGGCYLSTDVDGKFYMYPTRKSVEALMKDVEAWLKMIDNTKTKKTK